LGGTFYVEAVVSGNAMSGQQATIRYGARRFTLRLAGTDHDLSGVTYGNGTFVAVGANGIILTSP
jgi:hypothetical protein